MKCPICGNDAKNEICGNCGYSFGVFEINGNFSFKKNIISVGGNKNADSVSEPEEATLCVPKELFLTIGKIDQLTQKKGKSKRRTYSFNLCEAGRNNSRIEIKNSSDKDKNNSEKQWFPHMDLRKHMGADEFVCKENSDSLINDEKQQSEGLNKHCEKRLTDKKRQKKCNNKVNKSIILATILLLIMCVGITCTVWYLKNNSRNDLSEKEETLINTVVAEKNVDKPTDNFLEKTEMDDIILAVDAEQVEESEIVEEQVDTEADIVQDEIIFRDECSQVLYKYKKYLYFGYVNTSGYYGNCLEMTDREWNDYSENYSIQNSSFWCEYAFYDVNGDGSEELLISDGREDFNDEEASIIDLYMLSSSGLFRPFISNSLGYRERLHILNDGRMVCEGSGSWSNCSFDVYTFLSEEPYLVREYGEYTDIEEDCYFNDYTYCASQEQYYEHLNELLEKRVFEQIEWNTICGFEFMNSMDYSTEITLGDNLLKTWLDEGITPEKIRNDGYSLEPTYETFFSCNIPFERMITYYLGNTDIKLLFVDADLPKETSLDAPSYFLYDYDSTAEFHLVALESPAKYIIPDIIGESSKLFIEDGNLYIPNCKRITVGSIDYMTGWFPQCKDLTSYAMDDITDDTFIGVLSSKQCGEDAINYNYSELINLCNMYSNY